MFPRDNTAAVFRVVKHQGKYIAAEHLSSSPLIVVIVCLFRTFLLCSKRIRSECIDPRLSYFTH